MLISLMNLITMDYNELRKDLKKVEKNSVANINYQCLRNELRRNLGDFSVEYEQGLLATGIEKIEHYRNAVAASKLAIDVFSTINNDFFKYL